MSDLHFDIPEELSEEDYEDILFDRRNSIPIDMHPIEVDTTPNNNNLTKCNEQQQ